jgi:hypothetical protein
MKKILMAIVIIGIVAACSNSKKKDSPTEDNRIYLRADTLNVAKMTDTMVISGNVCRGCAYEESTKFIITDSLGVVALDHIETHDNNSPDMDGGSISKSLIIIPKKTGITTIRLYKFREEPFTAEDSARFTTYTIEIKN